MASSRSTEDLNSLIKAGKLTAGTTLHHKGRGYDNTRNVTATVTESGILFRGRTYLSPSAAARVVTNRPVDGWIFWKLPSGAALGTLRTS